nr:PE-PPE domain-containing protein [Mycolicibacterium malmesburyense]CRL68082.1 PE-PPE domain-containing protein [Mycolicibacterium malmesburyense]
MRKCIRVVYLSLLGVLSAAVLSAATALLAAVSLAATALIVPGTGTPNANDVDDYMSNFQNYYMQETECDDATCELDGVDYPASFWPIPLPGWCPNLSCDKFDVSVAKGVDKLRETLALMQGMNPPHDGKVVIAGYSQGARVVTIAKTKIANGEWNDVIAGLDSVEFVFIGNPNRPNGGILTRLGILGHIPILDVTTGEPTPTGPPDFKTKDWAIRWEGIADFPQYLLNPLAIVNSLLGFYYDHGTYLARNGESEPNETPGGWTIEEWEELTTYPEKHPDLVQIQKLPGSDTTYYTVRPKVMPVVRPLHAIPLIGKPIADFLEPILEVIIEETGYNRNIPYGQYSPIGLIPIFNPITLVAKLIPAVVQGVINFLGNFVPALAPKPLEITPKPVGPVAPGQDEHEEELQGDEVENLAGVSGTQADDSRRFAHADPDAMVLSVNSEGNLTLTEGVEGSVVTDPAEGSVVTDPAEGEITDPAGGDVITDPTEGQTIVVEEPQETVVIEPAPTGTAGEKPTDPADGNVVTAVKGPDAKKDPEVKKDPQLESNPALNRVDANGRSVSLNASPNQRTEGSKDDGKGTVQRIAPSNPDPSEGLTTKPDPTGNANDPEGADDAQDSKDSTPAAA